MKNKILSLFVGLYLLSACGIGENSAKTSIIIDTTTNTEPPLVFVEDIVFTPEEPIEKFFPNVGRRYDVDERAFLNFEFVRDFYLLPGFLRLISDEELNDWAASYYNDTVYKESGVQPVIEDYMTLGYIVDESYIFTGRDLKDSANMYTFICDFDLSEEQIRSIIADEKTYYREDMEPLPPGCYTEEQINALCSRDKARIVRAFARDSTIIKGDKFYSLNWFYLAPVKAYRDNNMTKDDLMSVLKVYEKYSKANEYAGEDLYVIPYVFDLLQQKIYDFLDGNIDVIELCGYDRDFNMPLAYEYYSLDHMESYFSSFDIFNNGDYNCIIVKEDISYSPYWVYYNKPTAYKEAGITPDELIEMLPKYKELGILTGEAYEALEEKIYAYAENA